ncbi:SDR family oxidoreductase [Salinibaculum rarum]|uniref:SDR family oxidoreductase n=1 Tax=Salinibaculum rarum TaxID=3058903 RepID=UPI00265E2AB1|nr:SDR family oxidoreductase [Salinibaculum sp. KK48]
MTDETALITGCSSGIGHATARYLADDGWTVYATSRNEDDLTDLAEAGCRTDELDVTSGEDIDRVVDRILDDEHTLDVLVNNAGYGQYGPVEDVPTDRVHAQFDVNVYGPHRLTRAVLPHMRDAGSGTIVNVSSVAGRVASPGGGVYSASKFALEAMSDALRAEVEEFGVDVVLVEPGPVETDFNGRVRDELDDTEYRSEYQWVYDIVEDGSLVAGGAPIAVTPERVAETIHDAISVSDPEARYPVGRVAQYMLYSRFLPDKLRDVGYRLLRKVS